MPTIPSYNELMNPDPNSPDYWSLLPSTREHRAIDNPDLYDLGRYLQEKLPLLFGATGEVIEKRATGQDVSLGEAGLSALEAPMPGLKSLGFAMTPFVGAIRGVKRFRPLYHGTATNFGRKQIGERGFVRGQSAELSTPGTSLSEDIKTSLFEFGHGKPDNVVKVVPRVPPSEVWNVRPSEYFLGDHPWVGKAEEPVIYKKPQSYFQEAETFMQRLEGVDAYKAIQRPGIRKGYRDSFVDDEGWDRVGEVTAMPDYEVEPVRVRDLIQTGKIPSGVREQLKKQGAFARAGDLPTFITDNIEFNSRSEVGLAQQLEHLLKDMEFVKRGGKTEFSSAPARIRNTRREFFDTANMLRGSKANKSGHMTVLSNLLADKESSPELVKSIAEALQLKQKGAYDLIIEARNVTDTEALMGNYVADMSERRAHGLASEAEIAEMAKELDKLYRSSTRSKDKMMRILTEVKWRQ